MAELKTFIHEVVDYPNAKGIDNGWWELGDDGYVYNLNGGRHNYVAKDEKERKQSTWDDITKDYLLAKADGYDTGWLAPDGHFYGCDYMNHSLFARYVFNTDERDLEEKRYCKIYRSMLDGKLGFDHMPGGHLLTEFQWKYLLDNDYTTPEEYDSWS